MALLGTLKIELLELGIPSKFNTIAELWIWLRRLPLIYTPPKLIIDTKEDIWITPRGYQYVDIHKVIEGSFGKLYLTYRQSNPTTEGSYCFIKTCNTHQMSLVLEGVLQTIARVTLEQHGFIGAIPRVLDICTHPTMGTILALERIHGSKLFAKYLETELEWNKPCPKNDKFIFSVLAQIATYMAILESDIGMNHRDLKGSNILMIVPETEFTKHIKMQNLHKWTIKGNHRCILIDFGFACIGKNNGETVISAGEYLPDIDFCPKEGRDLFLFFANLWSLPALQSSLTEKGCALFTKWLHDLSSTNWSNWLKGPEPDKMLSMYLLTSASNFQSPSSDPLMVLEDIASTYPDIVIMHRV